MASNRSKKIWQQSTPFAVFVSEQAVKRMTAKPLVPAGFGWRLLEAVSRLSNAFIVPRNVIEQTLGEARRGNLVATGIRYAPSKSDTPVIIPSAALASTRAKFLQNELTGPDFKYSDVRLIRKVDIPLALRVNCPNQTARQAMISGVIRKLQRESSLPKLRKQQIGIVRDALSQAGIENIGSDKNLERLIRQSLKITKLK